MNVSEKYERREDNKINFIKIRIKQMIVNVILHSPASSSSLPPHPQLSIFLHAKFLNCK